MNFLRIILLATVASLACSRPIWAQSTQPGQSRREIIKLTLHAAPATMQSLHYKLLPQVTDQTPGDAAPLYLLAARLGPDQKAAGDLVQEALDKYREMPLDQLAHSDLEKALAPFATRLKYVDLAARRERATFEFTLREEGFATLLPYLNDMRTNANLLGLELRLQIARSDWAGAAHTCQTGFEMCQQLNDHAGLVQGLVETGMAELLLTRLREWGARPDAPNLYWALSELPAPFVDLRSVSQWEQAMPFLSFPQLAHLNSRPLSSEEWRAVFSEVAGLRTMGRPDERAITAWMVAAMYSRAKQSLISQGEAKEQVNSMTPDQVVGLYMFHQYQSAAADAWKAWELPFWQFIKMIPQEPDGDRNGQHRGGDNPLMMMLPAVHGARYQFARLDREICIARTIEALRDYAAHHGGRPPASLEDVKDLPVPFDPISGEPIPYRVRGNVAVIEPAASIQALPELFELTFLK